MADGIICREAGGCSVKEGSPQLVCKMEDARLEFHGFLAIDTILGGHCAGGIRVTPDITEEEVSDLAASMTKKFGFINMYMGGAKAGIRIPQGKSKEERAEILTKFGERIAFILKSGVYYPGTDIGTTPDDLRRVMRGARLPWSAASDDIDSGVFTALAAVTAARQIARFAGLDLRKAQTCIEGFGKVGRAIALFMSGETNITGISTLKGAIYNKKGLDAGRLTALSESAGDNVVLEYENAERLTIDELLEARSDVLFLCGRPRAITMENAHKIKSRIIIGAGNLCFVDGAEAALYERGIYTLPDFITSSGGALGLRLNGMGLVEKNINKVITEEFALKVQKIIDMSWKCGRHPAEAAEDIVSGNLLKMRSNDKAGGLKNILRMIGGGKMDVLASKAVFKYAPKKYHRNSKVQEYLLGYAKEQFWNDKL